MAKGMLGGLFNPDPKRYDEEGAEDAEMMKLAQMDPFQQAGYAALSGASRMGRGLGTVAATAAGRDPRSPAQREQESMRAAMEAIGQLEDTDFSSPAGVDNYYKGVINILRKHNLPSEAHRAAQEWNEYKNKQTDQQFKRDDMERKRQEAERKAANAAEANRIKDARNKQLAQQGMPEFIQIVNAIEGQTNPVQRQMMIDRANQLAGGKIVLQEAGDRILVRNQRGDLLGVDMIGETPETEAQRVKRQGEPGEIEQKYKEAMSGLQRQYNAAVELHNHIGVEGITGRLGRWVGEERDSPMLAAFASWISKDEAGAALALHKQIEGGALLAGLNKLKAVSPTGSAGLGAVSNAEGDRVVSDAAALNRLQQAPDYRRQLATYIREMERFADRLAEAAPADQVQPIQLQKQQLFVPSRNRSRKPTPAPDTAPPAPAPAPRPAAAVGGDRVRVRRPDGATGTIPRAKLDEYKQKGYTELK